MKQLRIEPLGTEVDVKTATPIVAALIRQTGNKVKMVCGGKGLCATCHVKVLANGNALSTLTQREKDTLSRMTGADADSRLACQARVRADGCSVEVPMGIYLESLADLEALIGRRAEEPVFHPLTSSILIPEGKIITRSIIMSLKNLEVDIVDMLHGSNAAN